MMVLGGMALTTDLSKSADIDLSFVCWPWKYGLVAYWSLQIVGFFLGLFAISFFDDDGSNRKIKIGFDNH